jgi:hypothetical protein
MKLPKIILLILAAIATCFAQATNDDPAQHAEAALAKARNYFRYEYRQGSNSTRTTSLSIEIDETEPVQGWEGRFRTKGKALLNVFNSNGRSYQNQTQEFEILTERKNGQAIKVIDLTLK